MTHILFYIGLFALLVCSITFLFLLILRKEKKPKDEIFEIK